MTEGRKSSAKRPVPGTSNTRASLVARARLKVRSARPKGPPELADGRVSAPPPAPRTSLDTLPVVADTDLTGPGPIDAHALAELDADASCLLVRVRDSKGRERLLAFRQTEVTIGREDDNDLILLDGGVSRCHAMFTLGDDGDCTLIDLGSTNGTHVGERVIGTEPTTVFADQIVTIGSFTLRVQAVGAADARTMLVQTHGDDVQPAPTGEARLATSVIPPPMAGAPTERPPPVVPSARRFTAPSMPDFSSVGAGPTAPAPPSFAPGTRADSTHPVTAKSHHTPTVRPPPATMPPPASRRAAQPVLARLVRAVWTDCPADGSDDAVVRVLARRLDQLVDAGLVVASERAEVEIEARREVTGWGILEDWLDRDDVRRISLREGRILVFDRGEPTEVGAFHGRSESVARALRRLGASMDAPFAGEVAGWRLTAMPSSAGPLVELRRGPAEATLAAWVERGALAADVADQLHALVAARVNVLVVGDAVELVAALAGETAADASLWLGEGPPGAIAVEPDEDTVASLFELSMPYVFAPRIDLGRWSALLDAIARGREGVIAGVVAPDTERALARLAPIVGPDAARGRARLVASFPIAVEVSPAGEVVGLRELQ